MNPITQIFDKLQDIFLRLERLEKIILASLPASRKPARLVDAITSDWQPDVVLNARIDEALRLYDGVVNMGYGAKARQSFNPAILGPINNKDGYGIVPESVLRNRCSHRKIFAPNFQAGETSSVENATEVFEELIRRGVLFRSTIAAAALPGFTSNSNANVLLTPDQWERIGGASATVDPYQELAENLGVTRKDAKKTDALNWSNDDSNDDEIIDDEGFEEE